MSILFPISFWQPNGEVPPPEESQIQVQLQQIAPAAYRVGFVLNPEQPPISLAQAQFAFVNTEGEVPSLVAGFGLEGSPFQDWETSVDPEAGGLITAGEGVPLVEGEAIEAFDLQYEGDEVNLSGLNPVFPTLFVDQEEQVLTYDLVIIE